MYAEGLTTGEISADSAEIYGASVSKQTVSRITDKVLEEMTEWANRPLDGMYAAIFIEAIVVQGQGLPGRESADLRRDRRLVGRGEGCPRLEGRDRWGGCEVLVRRADRPEEPRRGQRVLRRL